MVKFFRIIAVFACALSFTAQAWANTSYNRDYCIDRCFSTWACSFQDESGRGSCEQSRNQCVQDECSNMPDDPAHVSGGPWGAVAYDKKSGAWGIADESPDRGTAKKSALGYCGQRGKDCDVVGTFKNTCVAVAVGTDGAMDWSDNDNVKQAGLDAIDKCTKKTKSGTRCFLNLWHCYFK